MTFNVRPGRDLVRGIPIIATTLIGLVSAVHAQQGSNFPSPGSDRGPNFPGSVSPAETNPTNWVTSQHQYTEPAAPGTNPRWNRWNSRIARWGR